MHQLGHVEVMLHGFSLVLVALCLEEKIEIKIGNGIGGKESITKQAKLKARFT